MMCDRKAREIERQSLQNNYQTSDDIRFRMLGRKEDRREQTKFSRNEDVEMGKREDQDHIRNEDIRKEAHLKPVETFQENERLKWFGHCLRRERNYICAKSLRLDVSRIRSRGRPKKRWRDNIQRYLNKTN